MKVKMDDQTYLWMFFAITFISSWIFWIPGALLAHGAPMPSAFERFLTSPFNPAAFGPLISALLLTFLQGGWKGVVVLLKQGIKLGSRKTWLLLSFLLPPVIYGGAVLASALVGATDVDFWLLSNPIYVIVGFFVILFTAGPLQEEFGWRGYALPRLQSRFNALLSSVILGILWWLWHLPLVFIPGRFMTDNLLLFAFLSVEIVLTSILFTWIYNNTGGSVLACMLLHAAMNWSIWLFLPGMKTNFSVIGLTVVFLAIAVIAIVWRWGASRLSHIVDERVLPHRA